jgi:hypothetical protein
MSNTGTGLSANANATVKSTANATAKATEKAEEKEKLNELFEKLTSYYDPDTEMFDIVKIKGSDQFKEDKIIKLFQELNKSNNYTKEGNEALYKIKRYLSEHKDDDTDEKIKVFKNLCDASEKLNPTAP